MSAPLSRAAEQRLVSLARSGDRVAVDALLAANDRLIIAQARRYYGRGVDSMTSRRYSVAPNPDRGRPWSADDLFALAALWGAPGLSLAHLARRFARTPYAVYTAAGRHGLARGVPPGWESVAAAARRTGYTVATLRRVLAVAGVRPSTAWASPRRGRSAAPKRAVRPADVDRAVAAWLACETVEEAARRAGVSPPTLRRALAATGCKAPAARQEWRVGEEEVGAALRWREARPPLATHAAARGMSAKVLARRMGVVSGWRGRRWTAAEVDAAVAARAGEGRFPLRRAPR